MYNKKVVPESALIPLLFFCSILEHIFQAHGLDTLFFQRFRSTGVVRYAEDHVCSTLRGKESIGVFHIDLMSGQDFQDICQTAGAIFHLNSQDIVQTCQITAFSKDLVRFYRILADQTQDAEILRVRDGKCAQVDLMISDETCGFRQTAFLIFDIYNKSLIIWENPFRSLK